MVTSIVRFGSGETVESSAPPGATFDIAVIGGGVSVCGIARDAAGRGWSVYLCCGSTISPAGGQQQRFGATLIGLGLHYNVTQDQISAWITIRRVALGRRSSFC
jgi:glycine/D-amino acid oxidase-like deaminating enzyme